MATKQTAMEGKVPDEKQYQQGEEFGKSVNFPKGGNYPPKPPTSPPPPQVRSTPPKKDNNG